jgi:hypothetical protein
MSFFIFMTLCISGERAAQQQQQQSGRRFSL